ncbi:hypothetical protein WN51_09950 [Melipona quadrifasciata]|uniref:Uncharacterized protein n=1 Tax=Melipona quadrifasciata TaxID=166423 RepID=A0A0M9ABA1_9HYME|nr:hypothetical protein WN51_09950 [Melipona quadrifasciata]
MEEDGVVRWSKGRKKKQQTAEASTTVGEAKGDTMGASPRDTQTPTSSVSLCLWSHLSRAVTSSGEQNEERRRESQLRREKRGGESLKDGKKEKRRQRDRQRIVGGSGKEGRKRGKKRSEEEACKERPEVKEGETGVITRLSSAHSHHRLNHPSPLPPPHPPLHPHPPTPATSTFASTSFFTSTFGSRNDSELEAEGKPERLLGSPSFGYGKSRVKGGARRARYTWPSWAISLARVRHAFGEVDAMHQSTSIALFVYCLGETVAMWPGFSGDTFQLSP